MTDTAKKALNDRTPLEGRLAYSVTEAANLLGIGRNAAYRLCASGEIGCVKIGGRLHVPADVLKHLLIVPSAAVNEPESAAPGVTS